jgi:hypothetical protein
LKLEIVGFKNIIPGRNAREIIILAKQGQYIGEYNSLPLNQPDTGESDCYILDLISNTVQ